MKALLPLIAVLAFTGVYLFTQQTEGLQSAQADTLIREQFNNWTRKFGQNYELSELEYRFQQFKLNYELIQQHNAQNNGLTLGLTQFAAMSNEEYRLNTLLRTRPERQVLSNGKYYGATGKALPKSIDWVKQGAVYATQDQGRCGSCWAFATIGGLQGLRYIVEGNLELLSAQQITSCTPKEFLDDKTQGCNGGEARYAYQYTADNGIEPASAYPYVNGTGGPADPCHYNKSEVVFYNEGVGYVPKNDVQAMKENLNNQPLSIAVDAGSIFFQLYNGGIIDNKGCGTDLNHAILLVGYNEEGEKPYWTVQNSWGTGWGKGGFGNIAITDGDGICGINMQVDFPTSIDQ